MAFGIIRPGTFKARLEAIEKSGHDYDDACSKSHTFSRITRQLDLGGNSDVRETLE